MSNVSLILFVAVLSAVLYITATVLMHFKLFCRVGEALWVAAIALNAVLVINNWVINGYVPFVSMYQVLTFLSLTFSVIYLYIKLFQNGSWMNKIFCIMPGVCLIGVCFMGVGTQWHFPPALQSPWFVPHVLVYMVAYTLCAVAALLSVISYIKKDDGRLEKGIYNLVLTAFPFLTAGMFFGAIWANEVWGSFWSFDAKENWALVTWLMYAVYLHFRRHISLKKYSKPFAVVGFLFIIVTMFFVNIMGGSSQHSYS